MRKIVLALASVAALGLAIPAVTAPAEARHVVVIKKKHHGHWNRGHHYGWYKQRHHWDRGHHYGWYNHHPYGATVVIR